MKSTILVCSVTTLLTACATTAPVAVPEALKPASSESLAMIVPAKGVQIYECRAKKAGAGYEWAFVAPDADLFDSRGNRIGVHGAGPVWRANDGSRIVGTLKQRVDAPSTDAIPWLLLTTQSTGSAGAFSNVTSIQRVNTAGGLAPSVDCAAASTDKQARIPYTADYYFFTNR